MVARCRPAAAAVRLECSSRTPLPPRLARPGSQQAVVELQDHAAAAPTWRRAAAACPAALGGAHPAAGRPARLSRREAPSAPNAATSAGSRRRAPRKQVWVGPSEPAAGRRTHAAVGPPALLAAAARIRTVGCCFQHSWDALAVSPGSATLLLLATQALPSQCVPALPEPTPAQVGLPARPSPAPGR